MLCIWEEIDLKVSEELSNCQAELIKNGLTALRQRSHTKIHSSLVYWPISLYTHVKNNLTRVFFKMNLSLGFHFRSGCVCMLALSTPLGYQCKPHEPWRLRLHHPHSPPYKHTQMRTRLPHCCHLHKSSVSVCGVCVCVFMYVRNCRSGSHLGLSLVELWKLYMDIRDLVFTHVR